MAENAANFTFTSQNRPSIFEIIAQQSLDETLHPALQRIALFLATNSPKKFQWLNKYYDETFLVINGVLQYHFLKQYDATFAENFYGLKRVLNTDDNGKLSNYYRFLSLIGCVLLPYVKRKIDERISFYQLEEADGCLRNNFDGNLKKLAIRSRSTFELIYGTLKIYNFIKYMSGRTDQQLPLLKLFELKLIYSEPNLDDENFWSSIIKGDFQFSKLTLLRNSVGGILTIMAFFLQFLQSWNTHKANYSLTALPNVEPPKFDNKATNYRNKCPICLQNWKIPTVLPISGYIFCFPCIVRYLREKQHCPITNLPAKPLDVIRLYDNE